MRSRSEWPRRVATRLHLPERLVQGVKRVVESSQRFTNGDRGEPESLAVGPGLRIATELRRPVLRPYDVVAGVAFIQDRVDHRNDPGIVGDDDRAAVARQPWYHSIALPDGTVTEGIFDHRRLVPYYGIPTDLRGKRVLDVATADGFWAFEFERRGGDVTALDIDSTDEVDLPPAVRAHATSIGLTDSLADGFELAHRLLGSSVRRLSGSVYDLDRQRLGLFDLVHSGDLLLHLREPSRALQQIRGVTRGFAMISDVFDPSLTDEGQRPGLIRYLGGQNSAGWWQPSLGALAQMVADAGFRSVEVVTVYNLALRSDSGGPWRAVMKATV